MSSLEVTGLSFSYGTRQVFSDVSFCVEPGEIFCLVGPNGCGKTTLEHCILGHLKPDSGSIRIGGKPLASYSSRALAGQMAYVPQSHTRSFPYRTLDLVAMGQIRNRQLFQLGEGSQEQALAVLEQLGIAHLADTQYTTLSGGELQMVLLARALCQDSDILVLDEPAAHLDVKRTQKILLQLAQISKNQGKTILLSTHDFNHPLLFQDEGAKVRMALMEKGTLSRSGLPTELLGSGCLMEIYGIHSRVLEVPADKPRHYLAAWGGEEKEGTVNEEPPSPVVADCDACTAADGLHRRSPGTEH